MINALEHEPLKTGGEMIRYEVGFGKKDSEREKWDVMRGGD